MENFSWMNHTVATDYPENGFKVSFGNSYQYAEGSTAPDQRTFVLSFPLMQYFVNSDGSLNPTRMVGSPLALEAAVSPGINMLWMEQFYNRHKTWKAFTYDHPVHGSLTVRFNKPLKVPAGIPGGGGAVGAFSIELIEIP
jgi:hypothetical protein